MADNFSMRGNGHEANDGRKLFVGGIVAGISENDLRGHFGQYGEIETVDVKTDPATGRPRGFAFIVFQSDDSIDKVVANGPHNINGTEITANKAKSRQGKIFIGGLVPEISDDDIESHFSQFGKIAAVDKPMDKQTNQRKNFCFVTFESEQGATEALKSSKQAICGHEVDVKKANQKPQNGQGGGGFGGQRGGGFGGQRGGGFGGHQRDGGFGGQRSFGQNNFGSGGFGGQRGFQQGGGGGQGNGFRNGNGGGFQGGKQRGGRGGFNQSRQQPY
ncbi:RNA-binding protein squid-like [Toxorhynchites rutilus septentrionalis]|uniref:RNA-binding protein squid-like n=1 Tax=Toxorhynchites rutilus septentrionalis TaxID=329112 RepID=UPI00247A5B30|nr:RNA-binding protein squid-like [Toxorhynchites rutilus septentrionalis]